MSASPRVRIGLARADIGRARRGRQKWRNLPRTLFLVLVLGHYGEVCYDCGWKYKLLWWSPAPLWTELVEPNGGGLLCPHCYDRRAQRAGVRLIWTPMVTARRVDGARIPTTNWWLSETRDWLLMGVPDPECFDRDRDCDWYPTQWTWQRAKELFADVVPPNLDTWGLQELPVSVLGADTPRDAK